jgi:hypothetical protein
MKNYEVKFKYADKYSNWQWHNQQGTFFAKDEYEAKRKCIELYGLGVDCDYEITSVVEV